MKAVFADDASQPVTGKITCLKLFKVFSNARNRLSFKATRGASLRSSLSTAEAKLNFCRRRKKCDQSSSGLRLMGRPLLEHTAMSLTCCGRKLRSRHQLRSAPSPMAFIPTLHVRVPHKSTKSRKRDGLLTTSTGIFVNHPVKTEVSASSPSLTFSPEALPGVAAPTIFGRFCGVGVGSAGATFSPSRTSMTGTMAPPVLGRFAGRPSAAVGSAPDATTAVSLLSRLCCVVCCSTIALAPLDRRSCALGALGGGRPLRSLRGGASRSSLASSLAASTTARIDSDRHLRGNGGSCGARRATSVVLATNMSCMLGCIFGGCALRRFNDCSSCLFRAARPAVLPDVVEPSFLDHVSRWGGSAVWRPCPRVHIKRGCIGKKQEVFFVSRRLISARCGR
mmetsp:Transcript_17454/g.47731  ORF Transcript_17454/g.47731 Transcript_17454/m.47731 type:complete len:394 (-) Transcript_17454:1182-2363(-)